MPFLPAHSDALLPEGATRPVVLNDWPVLLCKIAGVILAVSNRCTHAASPLQEGRVRRGAISCPLHGARFDLRTGACVGGPYAPLRTFEARVTDGTIEVAVPDEPPDQPSPIAGL